MTMEEIHSVAVSRAKAIVAAEVSFLEILELVDSEKVYLHQGYASLWSYCHVGLSMSEADTARFLKVMRTSRKFPELKKVVVEGTLSIPKAARIAPLLTPANQSEWIEKAQTLSTRKLEVAVVTENPKAMPREKITPIAKDIFDLKVKVNQQTLDLLDRMKDILSSKQRTPATTEEALRFALHVALEKHDPIRKAERNLGNPPVFARSEATKQSMQSRGPEAYRPLDRLLRYARKDGTAHGRARLSNALKHEVVFRDRGQCTARLPTGARCAEKRFLDIHHVTPLSRGGVDALENLALLCNGHHRASHLRPCEEAARPTRQSAVEAMTPA